jgi:glycosyltransferase involved in cell wall biosynthesis
LTEAIARASVLLFTPLWDEPFGLAAIEAMACGLPISAVENGAIREVAGDVARYAGADAGELAEALREAVGISRSAARERVERLFTLERMLEEYEGLYIQAIEAVAEELELPSFEAFELPLTEYAEP